MKWRIYHQFPDLIKASGLASRSFKPFTEWRGNAILSACFQQRIYMGTGSFLKLSAFCLLKEINKLKVVSVKLQTCNKGRKPLKAIRM